MKKTYYDKFASYRRKLIDHALNQFKSYYKGKVLDIGGRDKGNFIKPKEKVEKWIFADINEQYNPDMILDVCNMHQINSNSIDVINAIELFEHVEDIKKGLEECYRVLKEDGYLILSTPFMFHIHADPFDYQRWTYQKWRLELTKLSFKIEKLIIMGKFHTILAEMVKFKLQLSFLGRCFFALIRPFLNRMIGLDKSPKVKSNKVLDNYHAGYFIIARKNIYKNLALN